MSMSEVSLFGIVLPSKEVIAEILSGIPIQIPILICANGHYTQDLKKCPICKGKVIKCEFIESLIRASTFLCPHEGCGEVKSGFELQTHADNYCHYRPIRCPYGDCQTLIPFGFYFEHLKSRHQLSGSDDSQSQRHYEIRLFNSSEPNFGMWFKRFDGKTFFIRTFTSSYESVFWVELFGEKNDEKDYVAVVRLVGRRGHRTVVRFPVSPVRTDLETLNRTLACCHLSGKSLKQYFNYGFNDEPTLITVSIKFLLDDDTLDETNC